MANKPSVNANAVDQGLHTVASDMSSEAPGSTSSSKPSAPADETFDYLDPPQGPDELGRLANYRVLKVQGRGGMGTVFMAKESRLNRTVALKVMLPAFAKKQVFRARFLREARATAAIEHDHIVTIYDVSSEDTEVPYLAMQFLQGMTLEKWLKAGHSLNVAQILRVGKEVAMGLAAAHSCQHIHRDIKPSNIWLDAAKNGRVKILDFGLARPLNPDTNLTQEGTVLGTPAYMSPEQSRGGAVDERCDLFSLGCVLYRLSAGRLPFVGKDTVSILLDITTKDPPPVSKFNDQLPDGLSDLIHKLLAKNPNDRPVSAHGVVQALQYIERAWLQRRKAAPTRSVVVAPPVVAPLVDTVTIEKEPESPALDESAITNLEFLPTPPPGLGQPHRRSS